MDLLFSLNKLSLIPVAFATGPIMCPSSTVYAIINSITLFFVFPLLYLIFSIKILRSFSAPLQIKASLIKVSKLILTASAIITFCKVILFELLRILTPAFIVSEYSICNENIKHNFSLFFSDFQYHYIYRDLLENFFLFLIVCLIATLVISLFFIRRKNNFFKLSLYILLSIIVAFLLVFIYVWL